MPNSRSPLKDRPLRNPGQSLDEQIRDLISDYALGPAVVAAFMIATTILECLKYYQSVPPKPWLYSVVTVPVVGYAAFRFFRVRLEVRNRRLGRDGERAVGQFLEKLRACGYHVFHDVVGSGFNVDHILIGSAGVFTVETKTYSKRNGNAQIVFDGDSIRIGSYEPDRDPVIQAKAQASWLRERLAASTGREFEVRSAIVFPGWFVEYTGPKERTIWVLNPKALPAFLDHEPARLSQQDINLASFHLSRFVRTEGNNTDR
ncbi:MAG TPA: nuclease-related domain-containing protein [Pyrinomonadaceae bacterium]